MRDFTPLQVRRRQYVFETIRTVFERYGFQPIETPAMEYLTTLEGKYGAEGDKLLYRVLNSGDAFAKWKTALRQQPFDTFSFPLSDVTEKGLRYDLTVPLARYVVMHRHELAFPFRRYQIQPVFRADRPQKGRYREFYQCDADIVGSSSLVNEAELIKVYDDVFAALGLSVRIRINHRKILMGMVQAIGAESSFAMIMTAIDKWDKIGAEGVREQLVQQGLTEEQWSKLSEFFHLEGTNAERLQQAKLRLAEDGRTGCAQLELTLALTEALGDVRNEVVVDFTLARGLDYYTGIIYEVVTTEGAFSSSLGGGGRYDNLTSLFGLPDVSGVGISFGADRIYDVLEQMHRFPEALDIGTRILFCCLDEQAFLWTLPILTSVRQAGIAAEIYPQPDKAAKLLKYAHARSIPFVALVGSDELAQGMLTVKDMVHGRQSRCTPSELVTLLQ